MSKHYCMNCGYIYPEKVETCEVCGEKFQEEADYVLDDGKLIHFTNKEWGEVLDQMREYKSSITLDQEEIV